MHGNVLHVGMVFQSYRQIFTIQARLNEEAEKQHINFSSVLKEALIERISE